MGEQLQIIVRILCLVQMQDSVTCSGTKKPTARTNNNVRNCKLPILVLYCVELPYCCTLQNSDKNRFMTIVPLHAMKYKKIHFFIFV